MGGWEGPTAVEWKFPWWLDVYRISSTACLPTALECTNIWGDKNVCQFRKSLIGWAMGFPCGSTGKESACNVGGLGSTSGLGRSHGEGKGYPLQYSGLENTMDCIVYGAAKSRSRLSDFHSLHFMRIGRLMEDQDEGAKLQPSEINNFSLLYRAKRSHSMRIGRITWFIKDC